MGIGFQCTTPPCIRQTERQDVCLLYNNGTHPYPYARALAFTSSSQTRISVLTGSICSSCIKLIILSYTFCREPPEMMARKSLFVPVQRDLRDPENRYRDMETTSHILNIPVSPLIVRNNLKYLSWE